MQPSSPDEARSSVPARPQLKPWFRVAQTQDALVLEYGQAALVFEGRAATKLLPSLLPLLDGTRTVQEIVGELDTPTASAVERTLGLLAERNLLLDGPRERSTDSPGVLETAELLASFDAATTVSSVRDALADARVDVIGSGSAAPELVRLLRESGVSRTRRAGWTGGPEVAPDIVLAAPARNEVPAVEAWNRHALAHGQVWFQVLPFDGRFVAIGPLFVPGETCCFECYRLRRRSTSGYAEEFGVVEAAPVAAAAGPALVAAAAAIAASLVLRWLVHRDQRLPGVLRAYERGGAVVTEHRVYRVPRCPACAAGRDVAPPLPWYKETRAPVAAAAL